jgi:hypothetical protein
LVTHFNFGARIALLNYIDQGESGPADLYATN